MYLFSQLEELPWALGVILMVLIFVVYTIVGILLVRLLISQKTLKSHHDVAAVVFANLGVIYAVLLGFIVVNVQQRFDKIKSTVHLEASYLAELYEDAAVFSDKERDIVRTSIKAYADSVLNDEWPLLAHGEHSHKTRRALKEIWNSYYIIETFSHNQQIWYSISINKLNDLMNARLTRILDSRSSLGTEMWFLLISGAVVLVSFTWFFSFESIPYHFLLASIFAATTSFFLFLIYSLDTAFSGSVGITPEAIEDVVTTFKNL